MLATTVAGSALAQDEPAPFTGAHIEALAGHDNVGGGSEGREGFAYGIGAGYDFQVRGAVLGIEGEASDSTTRARTFDVAVPGDRARYNALNTCPGFGGNHIDLGGPAQALVAAGDISK